jgi:hypothetical protein
MPEEEEGEREREERSCSASSSSIAMSYSRPSTVEELQLEDFTAKGLPPPKAVAHWRAPLVEHEE